MGRFQRRDHAVADVGAGVLEVNIGGVVVIPKLTFGAKLPGLGAAKDKEGSNDVLPHLGNSCQPGHPRPPGKVEQNGFQVIIFGVGGGDPLRSQSVCRLGQESVAGRATRLFQSHSSISSQGGNISLAGNEWDVQARAKLFALLGFGVGLFALAVVEVRPNHVNTKFVKKHQQGGGVGAAAVSNHNGIAGGNQAGGIKMFAQAIQHGFILPSGMAGTIVHGPEEPWMHFR